MMPSEKNTKRVILALDQAYEKFIQLEDKSTDEAEIVAYRCYYTNIYESKLYVEQLQKEIERLNELLKAQQPRVLEYEELFKEETFSLWYEDKEHLLLLHVACVDGEYEDMHVNVAVEDSHENWSTYGKTWRMWSAIPTEEQRKAEPWKDGEQDG